MIKSKTSYEDIIQKKDLNVQGFHEKKRVGRFKIVNERRILDEKEFMISRRLFGITATEKYTL